MNIDTNRAPSQKWFLFEYVLLAILVAAAAALFLSGLSVRSLWGSEGRWAVIAREMMHSRNYFLPTINGNIYFDKPLLSYWAIIPFSLFSGVTETSARVPGALAGIGTVALVFAMGRNLFGYASGFLAGLVLLTTAMFGFWSRTASAEILNVIAIWSMLWVLPRGGQKRSFARYLIFYLVGAVSSFCKGPLAPAVAVTTVCALSGVDLFFDVRTDGIGGVRGKIARYFPWILSLKGFLAALCGLALFALLLFLPVLVTGSWDAVTLMWRENVVRFVKPFDHVEPFYIYLKHLPVFLLPWTFVAIASLIYMGTWESDPRRRWLAVVTVAIFLFFTISGSRRSYYILPLVPAFALIMGRSLAGFLAGGDQKKGSGLMKAALGLTAVFPLIAGLAMIFGYFRFEEYRHVSQVIVGPLVTAAGAAAFGFIFKGRFLHGSAVVALLFFCLLLWGFTVGTSIGEKDRTLKPFAREMAGHITSVGDEGVAMYRVGNSSLIFYLDRPGPMRTFKDAREVCSFLEGTPGGYLLTEDVLTDEIERECGRGRFARIVTQLPEGKKHHRDGLVLLGTGAGP